MAVLLEQFLSVVLAAVFLWSGAAKLGSHGQLTQALEGILRLSPAVATHTARVFSSAEAGVALLIVFTATQRVGWAGAVVLGASISVLSSYAVVGGRQYSCGCFGSTSKRPMGWANAGYGAAIVAVGAFLLTAPRPTAPSSVDESLIRASVVTAVVLIGLFVKNAQVLRRPLANFTLRKA